MEPIRGTLSYGITLNSVAHKDFEMGSLPVKVFLELEAERARLIALPEGADRETALIRHGMERLRRRMSKLGSLDLPTTTSDWLVEHMMWPDMLLLSAAAEELDARLEKFRVSRGWAPATGDGGQPGDGLDAR